LAQVTLRSHVCWTYWFRKKQCILHLSL